MAALALEVAHGFVVGHYYGFGVLEVTGTAIVRQALINSLIMTSAALSHSMRTLQREASRIVIELRLIPEVLQMTIRTHWQLSIVIVFLDMTGAALLAAALERSARAVTGLAIR